MWLAACCRRNAFLNSTERLHNSFCHYILQLPHNTLSVIHNVYVGLVYRRNSVYVHASVRMCTNPVNVPEIELLAGWLLIDIHIYSIQDKCIYNEDVLHVRMYTCTCTCIYTYMYICTRTCVCILYRYLVWAEFRCLFRQRFLIGT